MSEIKRSDEQLAQSFAEEHRDILSWRIRRPRRGEPHCWFVNGRLDEYGILTRDLGRKFLAANTFRAPQCFGTDFSDERVYQILDGAFSRFWARAESIG
jgi:hypothetical protein